MAKLSFYLKILVNVFLLGIAFQIIRHAVKVLHYIYNGLFDPIYSAGDIIANPVSNSLVSLFKLMLFIYLLWLFLKFRKVVYQMRGDTIFFKKNQEMFYRIGRGTIYYSIGMFLVQLVQKFLENSVTEKSVAYTLGYNLGESLGDRIPLLILALFLLIIAELISDGYQLKKENDLTI